MIFRYDELKEYVKEDFEQFYQMGFRGEQIFRAVLDEYEHGADFCEVENVCIHIFLILDFAEKKIAYDEVIEDFGRLMTENMEKEMKMELGNEYSKYIADLELIHVSCQ